MYKEYIKYFFRLVKECFVFKNTDNNIDLTFNDNETLKVMSFNLRRDNLSDGENNWVYRRDYIVDMIIDTTPDIICFQEVMPTMAKFLVHKLSKFYDNTGTAIFMNREISKCNMVFDEGLLVMWRKDSFDFADKRVVKLFDGRKVNLRRLVDVKLKKKSNGKCFNVINTHFCHLNDEIRKKSFDKVTEYISNLNEFYVCGDFNVDVTKNKEVAKLMTSICTYNHRSSEDDTTINSFGKRQTQLIIDYVFSNKDLKGYNIIKDGYGIDYLSDHYPVITKYKND